MNLFLALGYKEWMKTRRILGISALAFCMMLAYTFVEISHAIRLEEAVNVWYAYIFQLASVAPLWKWLPSLVGLLVALSQFVPEMTNKRLKLTLHLPVSETVILVDMLLYGLGSLLLLFFLAGGVLTCGAGYFLPAEVVSLMLWQILPWTVSGLVVYGFTVWVCMEPQWKQRILNTFVALSGLSVFFLSDTPRGYMYFGWGMAGILLLSFLFPLYSCVRFKDGVQ